MVTMDVFNEIEALEVAFSNSLPEGFLCTVERVERLGHIRIHLRAILDGRIEGFTHYISPITLQYLSVDQVVLGCLVLNNDIRDWIRKVEEE